MDRYLKFSSLVLVLLLPTLAHSGASLAQPEYQPVLGPGEHYSESRWGRPPTKVDTGLVSGYASHAVSEMEAPDEELAPTSESPVARRAARRPAGLVFENAYAAETAAANSPKETVKDTVQETTQSQSPPSQSPKVDPALNPVKRPPLPEGTASRKGVQEVALIAGDLGFFPKTVFVSRDVPVRIFVTSASKNTLCIMMDSFQVRRQVRGGKIEEITFTPNVPGKYRFYCPVNGMEGTMIVKEFATNFTADDVSR